MNSQEFNTAVKQSLKFRFRDKVDIECINSIIEQQYNLGYSLQDAISEVKLTEHYNPHLPEEVACRKIAEIARKYRDK